MRHEGLILKICRATAKSGTVLALARASCRIAPFRRHHVSEVCHCRGLLLAFVFGICRITNMPQRLIARNFELLQRCECGRSRALSVLIKSEPKLWISCFDAFLHANRYPLRSKTLLAEFHASGRLAIFRDGARDEFVDRQHVRHARGRMPGAPDIAPAFRAAFAGADVDVLADVDRAALPAGRRGRGRRPRSTAAACWSAGP